MSDKFKKSLDVNEVKQQVDPDPIVRKLKRDNKELVKRINQLKLQVGVQEDFFTEVHEHIENIQPVKVLYNPPTKKKVTHTLSAVTVWSDWHIGEVIEPNEIEGFNAYNLSIAKKRVAFLVSKILDWVNINRTVSEIDEIVIICLGDFISGDIHEELKRTNEFPTPVQCVEAGYLVAEAVAQIATQFNNVRVEFVTMDNHSRLTRKYQYKQGGLNSFNYLVGSIAQMRLELLENVEFNLHTVDKAIVNIKGYQYLCAHGHDIKGWAGFPYYGIDRVASKEAKSRMFKIDSQFHKLIIGHFHAPLNAPNWLINGSLSGTSELDHAYGRFSPPCQTTWLIHPRFGEWSWNPFWLHFAD